MLFENIVKNSYRVFIKPIFAALLTFFWINEVKGIEKIPREKPLIFASNHVSYFDFFLLSFVGYKIKREICFLAAKEVLVLPLFKLFLKLDKQIKGIGLDRGNPGIDYFKKAIDYLEKKGIIALFPEGTRSQDGNLGNAKIGFIKLALEAKVPIFPVALQRTFDVLPKYRKIPRFKKCSISIGKSINLNEYYNKNLKRGGLQKIADNVMEEIRILFKL